MKSPEEGIARSRKTLPERRKRTVGETPLEEKKAQARGKAPAKKRVVLKKGSDRELVKASGKSTGKNRVG